MFGHGDGGGLGFERRAAKYIWGVSAQQVDRQAVWELGHGQERSWVRLPLGPDAGALDAGTPAQNPDSLRRRHQLRCIVFGAQAGQRRLGVGHWERFPHAFLSPRHRPHRARAHVQFPRAEGARGEGGFCPEQHLIRSHHQGARHLRQGLPCGARRVGRWHLPRLASAMAGHAFDRQVTSLQRPSLLVLFVHQGSPKDLRGPE
jgi:hypothetical protein